MAKSKMFKFFEKIFLISETFPNFLSGQLKQRTLYAYAFPAKTVPPCNQLVFAASCPGDTPRLGSRCYQSQPRSLFGQSDAEINQLKAQMQQMQQDYEKRLASMESQVKSMQSQVALTASVAQSRTITGPDGKAVSMEGPVLYAGSGYVYPQLQVPPLPARRRWLYCQWRRSDV